MSISSNPIFPRITLFLAGLIGACGVIFSAMAAHGDDTHLHSAAATACMAQAPALLGIYIGWEKIRTALIASILIGIGCLLFAGDLIFRTRFGHGLFPMSAPTGGTMMILGWVAVAAGAFFRR
ncbi:DUF423 domain-containing protein [Rhizobium sp. TH2]|uniref:DUF423 domain-containing protein n=1 Tax=Rhizobium sp. TH2 TaxID=2775403 RepID=UPI002157D0FA|nr:DUF423 domain-containing protein [Rhizobium sp. TH2]UVC07260.1 DUF423 domain-containing protein [Rhizobium sp. TH2]